MAIKWLHLRCITSQLKPLADCEVGLLIGYNSSRALVSRNVIPHETMDHMSIRLTLDGELSTLVNATATIVTPSV